MATNPAAVDELARQLARLPVADDDTAGLPGCVPETNVLDAYRAHIAAELARISGVDRRVLFPVVSRTMTLDKGDLLVPVPAMRIKGRKPDELAAELVEKFPESPLVEKPVQNGTFIQFYCKPVLLGKYLVPQIRRLGPEFGSNRTLGLRDAADASLGRKRIIVEFSSPNIAKPFHAGHLRSTIIGGFLANLHERAGWDVVRINYLGDWGKQYGLLALGFDRYGDEARLAEDPINHLFEIYVRVSRDLQEEKDRIDDLEKRGEGEGAAAAELRREGVDEQARRYFRKMTDGDEAAVARWRRFRDLSITRYRATYERLNIHFDEYSGESQVPEAAMEAAARELADRGITEESDGAVIVDFTKHVPGKAGKSLERPIIRKRDGTALYLTRDISELLARKEKFGFDKMIYVVASAQDLHLKQLFKIVELMGRADVAAQCQHVNFGLVRGMSTRRGTVKFLDDILRDVGNHMHDVMRRNEDKYAQVEDPDKTADVLGISSVMVQDMKGKRINDYDFNMDAMTSFEGDTGPYLQYAHARLCSIARRAEMPAEELDAADLSLLTEAHAHAVVRMLARWPDTLGDAYKTLEPTTVLTYLLKLTHAVSASYDHLRIVGRERELMAARMALYDAARGVLDGGMRLLGLTPLQRM